MAYRVLIVDDSSMIRSFLGVCIQQKTDWQVCGEAENGEIALQKVRELSPDIVLLDVQMPVMNGFEAARRIKHEFPSTQILMISQSDSVPFAKEAIAAGASAYVTKGEVSTALIPALRKIESLIGNLPSRRRPA
jgi:YesN/AraC family two-component response regulator